MAFIQCECGEQTELSDQAEQIICAGCGKRFTMPKVEDDSTNLQSIPPATAEQHDSPLSSTMVQDLPAVTQFEQPFGDSIVAMASRVAPAVAVAGAVGASNREVATPAEGAQQPRRHFFSSRPYNPTPDQLSVNDTKPNSNTQTEFNAGLRLLDRYEMQRKIGQGGMSTVYEAYDEVRGENVALKVLLPNLAANPVLQERFLQEGRLSSNFSHPNIARVYDLHQTAGGVFLSMELLYGATLRHDMNRREDQRQAYKPTEVLALMKQICAALEVVHTEDVIHRDLKPENLWLGLDGSVKVMDFGIARDATGTAYTTGGRGSGTPYYIAPEQLAASPTIDGRADQYSVAIIMYELLTGELPQGAIVPPHEKNQAIPYKLSQAIFRALDSDPTNRFDSVQDFYEAARFNVEKTFKQRMAIPLAATLLLGIAVFAFARWVAPLLESVEIPVWEAVGPKMVVEDNEIKFKVRNSRNFLESGSLNFRLLADAPVGAKLDPQTGEFTWIPSESQGPGEYSFTVMAVTQEDGRSPKIQEKSFQISVAERVDLPVVQSPDRIDGKEHALSSLTIEASDLNVPRIGVRYELQNPPNGMTIDRESGELLWTPSEKHGGKSLQVPLRVYLAGSDNRTLFTERILNFRIEESIDPPIITSQERINGVVNQPSSFRVTVLDSNVPEIEDYFRLRGGDRIGMTLDPKTGEIFWTPTAQQVGQEIEVTIQVAYDNANRTEVLTEQSIKVTASESNDSGLSSLDGSDLSLLAGETAGGGVFGTGTGAGGGLGNRPTTSSHGTGHSSAPVHGSPFPSNNKPSRPSGGNNGRPNNGNNGRPNGGHGGRQDHAEKVRDVIDLVKKLKERKKQKELEDLISSGGHLRDKPKQSSQQKPVPSTRPFPTQGIKIDNIQQNAWNKSKQNAVQLKSSANSIRNNRNNTSSLTKRDSSSARTWNNGNNRVQQWSSHSRNTNSRKQSTQKQSRSNNRNQQGSSSKRNSEKWEDLKKLRVISGGR